MAIQKEPDFQALENNIIDVIKEEQIKLGYASETLRLYYPMESIINLLGIDYSFIELPSILDQFTGYVKGRLGNVKFSNIDKRFCFVIPPEGVTYVHEEVEDRYFLKELIDKVRDHNSSLKEILAIFYRYSDEVVCKEMDHGEFDYLVYFKDGHPDSFMYCLKVEEHHVSYHRYTKEDYKSFGFEDNVTV